MTTFPITAGELITAEWLNSIGAFLLYDSTFAGVSFPAASITTPSLPQTYKHLLVEATLLSDQSSDEQVFMRVNGDSGNHYLWQMVLGQGSSASASYAGSLAAEAVVGFAAASSSSGMSSFKQHILDYANASTRKGCSGDFFYFGASYGTGVVGGFYNQVGAISTLTFLPNAGNFASGRLSVYALT